MDGVSSLTAISTWYLTACEFYEKAVRMCANKPSHNSGVEFFYGF